MFRESAFPVREKVITASGYSRRWPRQYLFHRHTHAIDNRPVKTGGSSLQAFLNLPCRTAHRSCILKIILYRALPVHLEKINPFFSQDFIPASVECKSGVCLRLRKIPAVCRAAQMLPFFPLQDTSGKNAAPVSAQRMPYAKPGNLLRPADFCLHFQKSFREFLFIRFKIIQSAPLCGKPAVIQQDPAHRHSFFLKFPGLFSYFLFVRFLVKCIPGTPSQIAEYFGEPSVLPFFDPFRSGQTGKRLLHCPVNISVFHVKEYRLIYLAHPAHEGGHFQRNQHLSSRRQGSFITFSHTRDQAGVMICIFQESHLGSRRNFSKTVKKRRPGPPVAE